MHTQIPDKFPIPNFASKKSLGQNFLVDKNIARKILRLAQFSKDDIVVEIGPGYGVLTSLIAPGVKRLIAIEKDNKLASALQQNYKGTHVEIFSMDFLKFRASMLKPKPPKKLLAIGNLPYNISTPIIANIIQDRKFYKTLFATVQYEFAQRLVAKPNSRIYGALSCFVQIYTHPRILFKIPPTCFRPRPKVYSAFIALDLRDNVQIENEGLLFSVIQSAFQQRRKYIINALSARWPKETIIEICHELNIPLTVRAENLTVETFREISSLLEKKERKR